MKRASFTLFQPQRWMFRLGRSALMVLFVWCCVGIQSTYAQTDLDRGGTAIMPADIDTSDGTDTLANCYELTTCDEDGPSDDSDIDSPQFVDDGSNDGNYYDLHARADTVELCPEDQWHFVKVVFTKFDLDINDTLEVYDGNKVAVRAGLDTLATATGTGVSLAFGGWVYANCDPADNPSGCLTFVFDTNGDNVKGAGWEAWVDCADRGIELEAPNITSAKLTCDSPAYAIITIPAATLAADTACSIIGDSVQVVIINEHGDECIDTCLSTGGQGGLAVSVTDTFALGSYKVTYTLKSDTEKTISTTFSVQAPSLVCNDEINVPLGSACMIVLVPDDILEGPCDTIADTMYYNITITIGSGKTQQVLETTNYDNGNAVSYPIITKADLTAAGMTVCDATATVRIERIYYGITDTLTICNNGSKSTACETTISFSDQSAPWIDLTPGVDTLIACDTTGLAALLEVGAIDNCDDDIPVTYTVTIDETDPCFAADGSPDTTTATIYFSAVDDCGNVGTLEKIITIIRPNENEHIARTGDVTVECDSILDGNSYPGLQIGVWNNNAFEVKDTIELNTTEYICGYILTKKDVEIPANDCGKKLFRYWSILDWCNPEQGPSAVDTTFIQYTDTTAPEFDEDEGEDIDLELENFSCTYDITTLEAPTASDNCDDDPTVRLDQITIVEDGNKTDWVIPVSDYDKLKCDSFCLRWVAEDACHEQLVNDTIYQIVVIKDVTEPSAICTDQLNVSVPNDEGARIHAKDVNAGSYDACGIDSIQIRRKGSDDDWSEYVDVVCTDVHGDLQIEMRVTDKKGNTNICWMDVTVEDKIPPICGDLPDITKKCDDYHTGELGAPTDDEFVDITGTDLADLYDDEFGDPTTSCSDNLSCGALEITQYYKLEELNCGELEITRKWQAADWRPNDSNFGYQYITVEYEPNWELNFPADVDLSCEDDFPAAATAADIITNGSCDLWALEVTEKTFEVPGDICFKVERTYELINWCVYNAGESAYPVPHDASGEASLSSEDSVEVGRVTYVQVLKLYVNEPPVLIINEVETCIVGEGDLEPYGKEDVTPGAAPYECDTLRTFSASATNCAGLELGSDNFIWKFYVDGTEVDDGTGSSFTKVVAPKTDYKVEFWVEDGCGNSTGGDYEVEFWDCKKPTPYVLNGLAIEIMQTGSIQLWATDLDQGSYDNCTPKDKLDIRIALGDPSQGPQDFAGVDTLGKVVVLTCTELGTQSVSIYVIDEEENWDVVGTYVLVQNNMGSCNPPSPIDNMRTVAGKITNAQGENIELVNVSVNGGDNTMATGATGEFTFSLPLAGDYTITPEKNILPLNGVSTFDLVLISKHILGIQEFDTPYKYIAADVNKSGSITAFDMVQLRQLILNITSEFPNNSSWRFVDATHEFLTPNPAAENFDEFMSINNLEGEMLNVDFIATKIGDVNGSAAANSLLGAVSRRTYGTLSLNATDRLVEAGQTVTVDFAAANIATTQGYQFTMNFAGLELVTLNEGVAKAANFNTNIANRGLITTSWNGEATTNEVLFSLTFTANTNGLLSELISINSDLTLAEAYNTAGELLDVSLDFNSSNVSTTFGLNQNTPNPFNGETVIGFNLPKAGMATLKVMDVQGKILTTIIKDGVKGFNQVTVNAKVLGATGVLYYQLESTDNIATKKMIILE